MCSRDESSCDRSQRSCGSLHDECYCVLVRMQSMYSLRTDARLRDAVRQGVIMRLLCRRVIELAMWRPLRWFARKVEVTVGCEL